jgi:uncharacterized protein with HEPN domain
MYKDPKLLLRYMLEECAVLDKIVQNELTPEKLKNDEIVKRAVVKCLENIGEAAAKIPFEIREQWGDIKWKNVIGMRQRLAHDYWGIDYDIVWDAVQHKVPELKVAIDKILTKG